MRGVFEEPRKQLQRQQASDLDQFVYRLTNPTLTITTQSTEANPPNEPEFKIPVIEVPQDTPNKCSLSPDPVKDNKAAKKNWRRRILERKGMKGKIGSSDVDSFDQESREIKDMSFESTSSRSIRDMSFESTSSRSSGWRSPQVSFNCDSSLDASDFEFQASKKGIEATDSDSNDPKKKEKETKRQKLKRIITKPLRRSPSGCEKETPPEVTYLDTKASKNRDTMESRAMELLVYQRLFGTSSEDEGRTARFQKSVSTDSALSENDESLNNNVQAKSKSKILAKHMKKKLPFLRRQQTTSVVDTETSDKLDTPPPIMQSVTYDQASKWRNSLDDLLHDKNGLELFLGYLKSEFSEENLEFWIACEEFRTSDDENISDLAEQIYNDFVVSQAPKEVNLDSDTKAKTTTNVENPTREAFIPAQHKIQALMAKDSYPRFIESEFYQILLENVSKA